jgi:5-methylthioribose kinase
VDLNGPAVCGRATGEDLHSSFRPLNEAMVADYVKHQPHVADILGGTSTEWSIKEVGDGNLNFVYILIGPKGSFVLKQVCIKLKDLCFV